MTTRERQYSEMLAMPNGHCPNHWTGVRLPEGFAVTPLQ